MECALLEVLRAETEHRKLLRLCQEGKVPQACDHLAVHIEKVRQDLHALLKRGAHSSTTRRRAAPPLHTKTAS